MTHELPHSRRARYPLHHWWPTIYRTRGEHATHYTTDDPRYTTLEASTLPITPLMTHDLPHSRRARYPLHHRWTRDERRLFVLLIFVEMLTITVKTFFAQFIKKYKLFIKRIYRRIPVWLEWENTSKNERTQMPTLLANIKNLSFNLGFFYCSNASLYIESIKKIKVLCVSIKS
jgi:hypothetical protein